MPKKFQFASDVARNLNPKLPGASSSGMPKTDFSMTPEAPRPAPLSDQGRPDMPRIRREVKSLQSKSQSYFSGKPPKVGKAMK